MKKAIYLGKTPLIKSSEEVKGTFTTIRNEKFYKIENYNKMQDFFMTIVSNSDHWMFLSSNGSLTAGRKNRDNALFPYYTVDKIHDYKGATGSRTYVLIEKEEKTFLWEPFSPSGKKPYQTHNNIYKSIYGNKVLFEEVNEDLGISFRYGWYNSEKYGWVKETQVKNFSGEKIQIHMLDGIKNILPWGVEYSFQNEYSNLLDAYKKNELISESKLGLFSLSSIPVDKAEPSESLKATTVWSVGPSEDVKILISDKQVTNFLQGDDLNTETDIRASKGAYFINCSLELGADENRSWMIIADTGKDSADVVNLNYEILGNKQIEKSILQDIHTGTLALKRIVGSSDGIQMCNEELGYARHFSNTLFNVMRGGIFTDDYHVSKDDFILYIHQTNRDTAAKYHEHISLLPQKIEYNELITWAAEHNDPVLTRICTEYMPLTFSRRHGDPSRPWNQFSIDIKDENGNDKLNYEGNWRDIFQNWEALSIAYPEFIEGMITRFVNATTADGYNPYRITREGIDWEEADPDDPWAYIGYWGDHQIIYLQKFLEQSSQYHPGKIEKMLNNDTFVFASVPYRIKPFEDIVIDPKDTIVFDQQINKQLRKKAAELGADGKLLRNSSGEIIRTNFTEKVLVSLLTKLYNFVPEAGIWMNTQRPEWNDANNALVGNGASMVTLYYLRRSLTFWINLLQNSDIKDSMISEEVLSLLEAMEETFKSYTEKLTGKFSNRERFEFAQELGLAGSEYRKKIYDNTFSGNRKAMKTEKMIEFFKLTLKYLDHSIDRNKREDGLYHAYNLISFNDNQISIRYLYEMLEGQVAVLSSGYLGAEDSLEVLNALKASSLFRADQYSYILYPNRQLQLFINKNTIPRKSIDSIELLQQLLKDGQTSIIKPDIMGNLHFNSRFRNAGHLKEALEELSVSEYKSLVAHDREAVLKLYESVFDHQSFTGRSGTFYGYEGLGSIYWHMVSKLLLATQECFFRGLRNNANEITLGQLKEHYYEIKAGIGLYKNPGLYGAFPTDAYSHTPGGAGVKQPGLTGQVKEDILSRFGEIGLHVKEGRIYYDPELFNPDEILTSQETMFYFDLKGNHCSIDLKPGQIAFTFCQVPIICTYGESNIIAVEFQDGTIREFRDKAISADISSSIFARKDEIKQIHFHTIF